MGKDNKKRRQEKKRKKAVDARKKSLSSVAGRLKELLPDLHRMGAASKSPAWSTYVDFGNDASVLPLFHLLEQIQDEAQRHSVEALDAVTRLSSQSLHQLENAASDSRQRRLLAFLQFWLAIHPLALGIGSGMFQYSHTWLDFFLAQQGASGALSLLGFLNLRAPLLSIVEDSIEEWVRCYFYYSRVRGVMAEFGQAIFEPVYQWLSRRFPYRQAILAAAQMLPWAERHLPTRAPGIAKDFESMLVDTASTPRSVRKDIGVALSTHSGHLTNVPPAQRATWVLAEFRDLLDPHEPLQLLVTSLGRDAHAYVHAKEEMLGAIRQHRQFIRNQLGGRPDWAEVYGRSRFFHIFSPALLPLLENGLCALARQFLAALRGHENDLRKAPPLIVSAMHPKGTLYAVEGCSSLSTSTAPADITPLVKAVNAALGTVIVNTSDPSFPVEKPERLGTPSRKAAAQFESLLTAHLELPRLSALLGEGEVRPNTLVLAPGMQLPIQALMLKILKWTLPWELSPTESLPSRPLRRALVWASGTFTSELERDEVRRVLERAGLQVDIVEEQKMSRERFRQLYTQEEYDIIWVAVHGQYPHDSPHQAHLVLKEGCFLSLQELAELNVPGNGRRLLVLNVCDGATTATFGDMPELGLAAVATGRAQVLISHLWPVEPLVAATFGVLLALGLERTGTFFGAFEWACRVMQSGRQGILEQLQEEQVPELANRLGNRDSVFDNILDWGSAAYFE